MRKELKIPMWNRGDWPLLLALLIIIAIPGFLAWRGCAAGRPGHRAGAEAQAREYARVLYSDRQIRVLCRDDEADLEGYSPCSLVVTGEPTQAIECSPPSIMTRGGCRLSRNGPNMVPIIVPMGR